MRKFGYSKITFFRSVLIIAIFSAIILVLMPKLWGRWEAQNATEIEGFQLDAVFSGPACKVEFFSWQSPQTTNLGTNWASISLNARLRNAEINREPLAANLRIAAGFGVSCIGDNEIRDKVRRIYDDASAFLQIENEGRVVMILYGNRQKLIIISGEN